MHNKITTEYRLEPCLFKAETLNTDKLYADFRYLLFFKICAHELQVEHGKYLNIAKQHRKCRECDVVKVELHFLDSCVKLTNLHSMLIKNV